MISLPYATYAIASHRADAERATHRDFDAACAWIAAHADPPGPVLSRHPGEVFLHTGRTGISLDAEQEPIQEPIYAFGAAYILLDDGRFLLERSRPVPRFLADYLLLHQRFTIVGTWGKVVVYRVRPQKPD